MTPSTARQSVIIKCSMGKSILLGNYEFYYVGGLMNRIFGLHANADMSPEELKQYLDGEIPRLEAADEKEAYLLRMVKDYEPMPEQDAQMRELFEWGASEQELWQVHTGAK